MCIGVPFMPATPCGWILVSLVILLLTILYQRNTRHTKPIIKTTTLTATTTNTPPTETVSSSPPVAIKKSKYSSVSSTSYSSAPTAKVDSTTTPSESSTTSAGKSVPSQSTSPPLELDPAEQADYNAAKFQTRLEYTLIKTYQLLVRNLRSGRILDGRHPFHTELKKTDPNVFKAQLQQIALDYPHYNAFDETLGSVVRFSNVKNRTQCIFAKKSKVWTSPNVTDLVAATLNSFPSVEAQTLAALPGFVEFTLRVKDAYPTLKESAGDDPSINLDDPNSIFTVDTKNILEWPTPLVDYNLDAFMIEIEGSNHVNDIDAFGRCIRAILRTLSFSDPVLPAESMNDLDSFGVDITQAQCMAGCDSDKSDSIFSTPRWHFTFLGETFFVTCFAPCYPKTHARYMFVEESGPDGADMANKCYVLFQPELSFLRRNLSPDTKDTNWLAPKTERDRIRIAFKQAGRPYVIPDSIAYPTAEYIVPPTDAFSGRIIRWWRKATTPTEEPTDQSKPTTDSSSSEPAAEPTSTK